MLFFFTFSFQFSSLKIMNEEFFAAVLLCFGAFVADAAASSLVATSVVAATACVVNHAITILSFQMSQLMWHTVVIVAVFLTIIQVLLQTYFHLLTF